MNNDGSECGKPLSDRFKPQLTCPCGLLMKLEKKMVVRGGSASEAVQYSWIGKCENIKCYEEFEVRLITGRDR